MARTRHSTFVIGRTYSASPPEMFNAFTDTKGKEVWFSGPPDQCNSIGLIDNVVRVIEGK